MARLDFECTYCRKQQANFLIHVDRKGTDRFASVAKFGQWPSVRPELKADLRSALGDAGPLYQKGLSAEGVRFGIGAFVYYRRVAEDIIERLMGDLRRYADEHDMKALVAKIDEVSKEEQQASKRIEAVKELLPKALRIGDINPLGTIYGALSGGLHGGSDEECLDQAAQLRVAIEFLVTKLSGHVLSADGFTKAIRSIQETAKARAARNAKKQSGKK